MRIKTTYGQLKVGDRFFCSSHSPKGACRMKTTPRMFTQLVDEDEVYSSENWQDDEEVWIDAEEKIKQQAAEIERLKTLTSTGHCPVCGGYVGELISSIDEKRQVNNEN